MSRLPSPRGWYFSVVFGFILIFLSLTFASESDCAETPFVSRFPFFVDSVLFVFSCMSTWFCFLRRFYSLGVLRVMVSMVHFIKCSRRAETRRCYWPFGRIAWTARGCCCWMLAPKALCVSALAILPRSVFVKLEVFNVFLWCLPVYFNSMTRI